MAKSATRFAARRRGIPNEEANPLPPMGIDPDPAHDVNGKHKAVPLGTLNVENGRPSSRGTARSST